MDRPGMVAKPYTGDRVIGDLTERSALWTPRSVDPRNLKQAAAQRGCVLLSL